MHLRRVWHEKEISSMDQILLSWPEAIPGIWVLIQVLEKQLIIAGASGAQLETPWRRLNFRTCYALNIISGFWKPWLSSCSLMREEFWIPMDGFIFISGAGFIYLLDCCCLGWVFMGTRTEMSFLKGCILCFVLSIFFLLKSNIYNIQTQNILVKMKAEMSLWSLEKGLSRFPFPLNHSFYSQKKSLSHICDLFQQARSI